MRFDKTPGWCDHSRGRCCFRDIGEKLKSYESMTWRQIRNKHSRDHVISDLGRIIPEARKKLLALKLDDFELWRLRFGGDERFWGVKINHIFYALWYDPLHKVCPSRKKHT